MRAARWVAGDVDHRLTSSKLAAILRSGAILKSDDLPWKSSTRRTDSQFPLAAVK